MCSGKVSYIRMLSSRRWRRFWYVKWRQKAQMSRKIYFSLSYDFPWNLRWILIFPHWPFIHCLVDRIEWERVYLPSTIYPYILPPHSFIFDWLNDVIKDLAPQIGRKNAHCPCKFIDTIHSESATYSGNQNVYYTAIYTTISIIF